MKFRVLFFFRGEPSCIDIIDSDGRAIYGGWWDGRDTFLTPYLDANVALTRVVQFIEELDKILIR